MTLEEILAALKDMKGEERIVIIETAARLIREEAEEKAKLKAEQQQELEEAAKEALPDYLPGGPLYDLWSPDSEPYYDSEDEIPLAPQGLFSLACTCSIA